MGKAETRETDTVWWPRSQFLHFRPSAYSGKDLHFFSGSNQTYAYGYTRHPNEHILECVCFKKLLCTLTLTFFIHSTVSEWLDFRSTDHGFNGSIPNDRNYQKWTSPSPRSNPNPHRLLGPLDASFPQGAKVGVVAPAPNPNPDPNPNPNPNPNRQGKDGSSHALALTLTLTLASKRPEW